MTVASTSLGASTSRQSRVVQLALAALLGIFVVGFVGFSHIDAVHNARARLSPFDGFPLPLTKA